MVYFLHADEHHPVSGAQRAVMSRFNLVSLGYSVTRRYTKYRPWVAPFIARKLGSKRGGITQRRHLATMPPMRVRPLLGYERRRPFFCGDCDRVHPNGSGSACRTH